MLSFQDIILQLQLYWSKNNCSLVQPYDAPMGAGTLHPMTLFKAIGPKHWNVAYVQACRRPKDGRYGKNPMRSQHYYQFQVLLKPSPSNFQSLYLESLYHLGVDPQLNDVRFVEDDWANPSVGAWGLGWEVWLNGMEISQITYMQQVGGIECAPIPGELTYGLERIAMHLQGVDNVQNIIWDNQGTLYGDLFLQSEQEFSAYSLEYANTKKLMRHFSDAESSSMALIEKKLPLPAYDYCLTASHLLNLLLARGCLGTTERASYLSRVRALAKASCQLWLEKEMHSEKGII